MPSAHEHDRCSHRSRRKQLPSMFTVASSSLTLTFTLLLALITFSSFTRALTDTLDGPYEDIQSLLHAASAESASIAALDHRGPLRVLTAHHHHTHIVPHDMPSHVAEHLAVANTPRPDPVRIVASENRAQQERHAQEDAQYRSDSRQPTRRAVNVEHTVNVIAPVELLIPKLQKKPEPTEWTIKDPTSSAANTPNAQPEYHFPLVDRRLQRPTFPIIADTDGSEKAGSGGDPNWKPHTAAELKAEALKLLKRAKTIAANKKGNGSSKGGAASKQNEDLGVFDSNDIGYEDELTRLKRVSARMNRLREQIELPHMKDTFEGGIQRKKYYLKIYTQLKKDATDIIESYALRTGHSIFEHGGIDPSIAAYLPPNSVSAILAQYGNPTRGREDETPRDVISGREAKKIRYTQAYHRAKEQLTRLPLPPVFATGKPNGQPLTKEERRREEEKKLLGGGANSQPANENRVIATSQGVFGEGRPSITAGTQSIGRSSVHIGIVNPTETQKLRGLPYQVNLKDAEPAN